MCRSVRRPHVRAKPYCQRARCYLLLLSVCVYLHPLALLPCVRGGHGFLSLWLCVSLVRFHRRQAMTTTATTTTATTYHLSETERESEREKESCTGGESEGKRARGFFNKATTGNNDFHLPPSCSTTLAFYSCFLLIFYVCYSSHPLSLLSYSRLAVFPFF